MMLALVLLTDLQHWGIPLLPRTNYLLTKYLTATIDESAQLLGDGTAAHRVLLWRTGVARTGCAARAKT